MQVRSILKEVNKEKDVICAKLKMQGTEYKLKASFSGYLNGSAFRNGKGVKLSRILLKKWETDKNIVKFMLAHELGHAKFGDNTAVRNDTSLSKYEKQAVILLSEMRANIVGSSALNFPVAEMDRVQRALHDENNKIHSESLWMKLPWSSKLAEGNYYPYEANNKDNIKYEFGRGYPTRKMIAIYTSNYRDFNDNVKNKLLDKFYQLYKGELNIEKLTFKNNVLNSFKLYFESNN